MISFLSPKSLDSFFKKNPSYKGGVLDRTTRAISRLFYQKASHSPHPSTSLKNKNIVKKKPPKPKKPNNPPKPPVVVPRPTINWDELIAKLNDPNAPAPRIRGVSNHLSVFLHFLVKEPEMQQFVADLDVEGIQDGSVIGNITVGEHCDLKDVKEFFTELQYFLYHYSSSSFVNAQLVTNTFNKLNLQSCFDLIPRPTINWDELIANLTDLNTPIPRVFRSSNHLSSFLNFFLKEPEMQQFVADLDVEGIQIGDQIGNITVGENCSSEEEHEQYLKDIKEFFTELQHFLYQASSSSSVNAQLVTNAFNRLNLQSCFDLVPRPDINWDEILPVFEDKDRSTPSIVNSSSNLNAFLKALLESPEMRNSIRDFDIEGIQIGDRIGSVTVGEEWDPVKNKPLHLSDEEQQQHLENIKEYFTELKYFLYKYSQSASMKDQSLNVDVKLLKDAFNQLNLSYCFALVPRSHVDWNEVIANLNQLDRPTPILNGGSDCFLNSFLQVLLNDSKIITAIGQLPDDVDIDTQIGDVVAGSIFPGVPFDTQEEQQKHVDNLREFITELKYFILEYSRSSAGLNVRLLRNAFSKLSAIPASGQQDPAEVWKKFSGFFNAPVQNADHLFRDGVSWDNRIEPNSNSIQLDLNTEDQKFVPRNERNIPSLINNARFQVVNPIGAKTDYKFGQIPPFLMLELKRFSTVRLDPSPFKQFLNYILALLGINYEFKGHLNTGKIDEEITAPLNFDLRKDYIELGEELDPVHRNARQLNNRNILDHNGRENIPYQLSGFVFHSGDGVDSGHYFSYVKKNGKWFRCNDRSITEIDEENPDFKEHKDASYMYYYTLDPQFQILPRNVNP